jgi:SAM-dependent methyltransferase
MDQLAGTFSVKRPATAKAFTSHLQLVLKDLNPRTILDVGFGPLKRSTLALNQVFPSATIHAIDNDVLLVNKVASEAKGESAGQVSYLFGDADLWLPSEQYDLIVMSLVAHAFNHPLRAIANLIQSNLKPGGHVLFVHRTDDVMRATGRLDVSRAPPKEAVEIQKVWRKIASTWEDETFGHLELPWRTRFVSDHNEIAECCKHLSLAKVIDDCATEHTRENPTEKLEKIFGTASVPPQYEAPRSAWEAFRSRGLLKKWPACSGKALTSKVRLSSFLYQQDGLASSSHDFFHSRSTTSSPFLQLSIKPEQKVDDAPFVQSITSQLPVLLDAAILDFYYITGDENFSMRKKVLPGVGMPRTLEVNLLTKATEVWQQHRGNHEFLFFVFPALENASVFPDKFSMPDRASGVFGWKKNDTYLIPLFAEDGPIRKLLTTFKFDTGEISGTANYLKARGQFTRTKQCSAIYYVIFRSRVLNKDGTFQALSFLTTRWLHLEEVRTLASVAHSVLLAMEEQRMVKMVFTAAEKETEAKKQQQDMENELQAAKNDLAKARTLEQVLENIKSVQFTKEDLALKNAYDRLINGTVELRKRIVGAALLRMNDATTVQEKFFNGLLGKSSQRGSQNVRHCIDECIKAFGGDVKDFQHKKPPEPRKCKSASPKSEKSSSKKATTSNKAFNLKKTVEALKRKSKNF